MKSDNGGNFKQGEKDLRSVIDGWNQEVISEIHQQRNIQWIFKPPDTSHNGGV